MESTCQAVEPSLFQRVALWFGRLFEKKRPSNYLTHAEREFRAAGYEPVSACEDGPNKWMQQNVMELLETFSKQGHSGFSAPYCVELFSKLARFQPLGPITGEDWEWMDVSDIGGRDGGPLFQNIRASHVFKDDEGAYDIDGVVFEEPDGCRFTGRYSRVAVSFPYTPSRVTAYVGKEASEDERRLAAYAALAAK